MTTHHAAPRAWSRAWFGYYFDFVLYPAIALAVIAVYCRSSLWIALAVIGFVSWTFVEYWTHRTLLHRFFWHGVHERHHLHPAEYIVFDFWKLPLFFAALFFALPPPLYAGFVLGYVWFLVMHHWLHHIDLRPHTWLHAYAIWHNRHHKFNDCNFGITTPVWDSLFGTSR